ncbi:signal peptidase I [Hyphococcus sp.]|uniref:signal peptidase I n=1 Tax=Hyphococcus sp. TaxID=2038636 RepID=UPI0035C6A7AE
MRTILEIRAIKPWGNLKSILTDTEQKSPVSTRRVRPWIAALLTFFGWGLGLFYARQTRAAITMSLLQIAVSALFGAAFVGFLFFSGAAPLAIMRPAGFAVTDLMGFGLAAITAVGIWLYVSRREKVVEKAGPARLLGYLGIWLLPVLATVVLGLLMRNFLLQPYNIPAASMKPTLQTGDHFVVSKWTYGYSGASIAPFGKALPRGRIFAHAPQRGDIVVFKNRKDSNKDYVKRIIGLPGDTVQMLNGRLYINDEPVRKELVEAYIPDICGPVYGAPTYRETLDNGVSYIVQECADDEGQLDNTAVYHVPAGHYFMMGDNRDQSMDSRVISQVGFIAFHDLVGKARVASEKTKY